MGGSKVGDGPHEEEQSIEGPGDRELEFDTSYDVDTDVGCGQERMRLGKLICRLRKQGRGGHEDGKTE